MEESRPTEAQDAAERHIRTPKKKQKKTSVKVKSVNRLSRMRDSFFSGGMALSLRFLLVTSIVASGIAVVYQVQLYRKSFTDSQQLRVERKKLNTEWHKLLIEQQTFGATTQIGGRAVLSMGMYSPKSSEVITLNVRSEAPKTVADE